MKILILALVLGMVGCSNNPPLTPSQRREYWIEFTTKQVIYSKDTRTNLCYAYAGVHGFTNVPCTKEVEDLIGNKP